MSEHECIIGLLYKTDYAQPVTVLDLKDHIEKTDEYNNSVIDFGMDWMIKIVWSLKDYADKRKSTNLTRFDFCPECGKKIDWKAIREEGEHEAGRC